MRFNIWVESVLQSTRGEGQMLFLDELMNDSLTITMEGWMYWTHTPNRV